MSDSAITSKNSTGNIEVVDKDNQCYSVFLQNFEGELVVATYVNRLKIVVEGKCKISNPIKLLSNNRLDGISVVCSNEKSTIDIKSLEATCIDLIAHCNFDYIIGNVVKIRNSQCNASINTQNWITATGHIDVIDSILSCSGALAGIVSPYILIDNSTINIVNCTEAISGNKILSLEHCEKLDQDINCLITSGKVLDDNGNPKSFIDIFDRGIEYSRRSLYNHEPMKLASEYDKYKEDTGYTDVNLHEHVDQEGQFEPPKISSDTYDSSICSLHQYRTTESHYQSKESCINEIP